MKKKIFILLFFVCLTVQYFAQQTLSNTVKFDKEVANIGKVKQSKPASFVYKVTNISKLPLMIESVTPSCGCTAADYTKTPIAPGKAGFIKGSYNAATVGEVNKTITVKFSNIPETKTIYVKGEVLPATPAAGKS